MNENGGWWLLCIKKEKYFLKKNEILIKCSVKIDILMCGVLKSEYLK